MSDDAPRRCKICCKPIETGARKCTECGSYQNAIRRHLNLSTSVLALLVALVSVLGFVIPIVNDAFAKDRATVIGSLLSHELPDNLSVDSESGEPQTAAPLVSFVLFNDGTVPLVLSPDMSYEIAKQNLTGIGNLRVRGAADQAAQLVLGPGESRVFHFPFEAGGNLAIYEPRDTDGQPKPSRPATGGPYEITFHFVFQSRLGRRDLNLTCLCQEIPEAPTPWTDADP